jgi:MFS family permease
MAKNTPKLKLTILLVSTLTVMSIVTISPSLPEMSTAFPHIQNAEFLAKLALTLPALFIAITSPFAGVLIDRYGRIKMLWVVLLIYAIAGTAGFYLESIYHILISRALLGISVGVSMTIVITLIADYFEGAERQKFVGIQVAFMSLGGIVFIGLGGVLADIGWRYPFLLYLFSLPIIPLTILFLYEPEIERKKIDQIIKIKPPGIVWLLMINVMVMWVLFFMIPVQIPFFLKAIGVEKNALVGLAIALSTAFSAVSSFSYSKIKNKLDFFTVFCLGYLFLAISFGLVAIADTYVLVAIAMGVGGFGMGMMIPNTNMWIMKVTAPEIRGKVIGGLTTFWFFGQFISPIMLMPISSVYSFSEMFFIGALFLVVLSIGFFTLHLIRGEKMSK